MIETTTDYEVIEAFATLKLRRTEDDRADVAAKIDKANARIGDLKTRREHLLVAADDTADVAAKIDELDARLGDVKAWRDHLFTVEKSWCWIAEVYSRWRDESRREEHSADTVAVLAEGMMTDVFGESGRRK